MERELKRLLDFQRIAKNDHLERIIKYTTSRYSDQLRESMLSDDELEIFAAGELHPPKGCLFEKENDKDKN